MTQISLILGPRKVLNPNWTADGVLLMADLKMKWKDNAQGKVFVDQSCIACDACVLSAPKNFTMHEEDGHAFVSKQPESPEEESAVKEAIEGCPVEAIGDFGDKEEA